MSIAKNHGTIKHKRIGVRDASTFTGFCGVHDDQTFAPVEKQPLIPTAEQCFLLSYRAVCRELFQKRLHHESISYMRELDHGRTADVQENIQFFADLHEIGTLMGLADIQAEKNLYDEMFMNRNYGSYRRLVISFSKVPDVLSTGSFFPEFDFAGNPLQDLMYCPLKIISVSIVPSNTGGFAVLGWHPQSDVVCVPFVNSLLRTRREDFGDAIVRVVFEHIENTYMRPSWWEGLNEETRDALVRRANSGTRPNSERDANCLTDDGFRYVDWPVTNIETVLS
jgi:hypothetical protein